MDPQLKQRLIGAAVLVSLAVLVVPLLLDGGYRETSPPRRDMAPMPPDQFEEAVPALPDEVQGEIDAGIIAGADELAVAAGQAAALPGDEPPLPADIVSGPAVEAAPEASRPPAAVDAPPVPAPAVVAPAPGVLSATAEQWTVQLGSFASRDNAEGLLRRMAESGVTGFILPLEEGGKTSFRVRAGPVAGRAAAERLRKQLEDSQAIRGMLVRHP
jgi:DedD protein